MRQSSYKRRRFRPTHTWSSSKLRGTQGYLTTAIPNLQRAALNKAINSIIQVETKPKWSQPEVALTSLKIKFITTTLQSANEVLYQDRCNKTLFQVRFLICRLKAHLALQWTIANSLSKTFKSRACKPNLITSSSHHLKTRCQKPQTKGFANK